jgi:hypothetical protein
MRVPQSPPSASLNWQESHWLYWHDPAGHLGGIHRIGHEPNWNNSVVWCGLSVPGGARFRLNSSEIALRSHGPADQTFDAEPLHLQLAPEQRLTIEADDLQVDLHIIDETPEVDTHAAGRSSEMSRRMAAMHLEAACRFEGTVIVRGEEYRVDAQGWRDHSAGTRDWGAPSSGRYWAGFVDGEFVCASQYCFDEPLPRSHGYVLRPDGQLDPALEVDFTVLVEADGLAARGARIEMPLVSGATASFECTVTDAFVFSHREMLGVSSLTVIGDALAPRGHGNMVHHSNPRRGHLAPAVSMFAANVDGVSMRPPARSWCATELGMNGGDGK